MYWKGKKEFFTMTTQESDGAFLLIFSPKDAKCDRYAAYGLLYGTGAGGYRERYHKKLCEF